MRIWTKNKHGERRIRKWQWLAIQFALVLFFAATLFVYLINLNVQQLAKGKVKDSITEIKLENAPRVAIVFGAGVAENNEASPALYDRVVTAVELYRANRVNKILMSGDNRFENYNEPDVMKKLAVSKGIAASDIIEDFAGRRTYDTCYRAKEIFGVERAILVTQQFHLNRALYLCESFGINSDGITADRRIYPTSFLTWQSWRETFAIAAAWLDVNLWKPQPVLGEKELIKD